MTEEIMKAIITGKLLEIRELVKNYEKTKDVNHLSFTLIDHDETGEYDVYINGIGWVDDEERDIIEHPLDFVVRI